jgi:hypothetical protein
MNGCAQSGSSDQARRATHFCRYIKNKKALKVSLNRNRRLARGRNSTAVTLFENCAWRISTRKSPH